jgi:hypothetical protein
LRDILLKNSNLFLNKFIVLLLTESLFLFEDIRFHNKCYLDHSGNEGRIFYLEGIELFDNDKAEDIKMFQKSYIRCYPIGAFVYGMILFETKKIFQKGCEIIQIVIEPGSLNEIETHFD